MVFESKTCLKKIPDAKAFAMVSLYSHYQNNILPFSGGLLDQPNYFVDAMSVIRGALDG